MADLVIRISGQADSYSRELKRVQKETQGLQDAIASTTKTAAVAFAGLAGSIGLAVGQAGKFEQIQTQFEVLTGSAEKATETVKNLSDFAAATPFAFTGIAKASQQLLGFGFTSEQLVPKLKEIGNVAAAIGKPVDEVGFIFGQVSAAGKLTGERLLQFQERAIPIGPAIAKTLGVAESSVKDLVSKGAVDFKTFEKAFASLSQEGGFAFGAIEKQSKTFNGQISTLKDNIQLLAVDIGKVFLPIAKQMTTQITAFIGTLRDNKELVKFGAIVAGVTTALAGLITAVGLASLAFIKFRTVVLATSPAMASFKKGVFSMIKSLRLLKLGIRGVIGATGIGLLVVLITDLALNFKTRSKQMIVVMNAFAKNFKTVVAAAKSAFEFLKDGIKNIASFYIKAWAQIGSIVFDAVNQIADFIVDSFGSIATALSSFANTVIKALGLDTITNAIVKFIKDIIQKLIDFAGTVAKFFGLDKAFDALTEFLSDAKDGVKDFTTESLKNIKGFVRDVKKGFSEIEGASPKVKIESNGARKPAGAPPTGALAVAGGPQTISQAFKDATDSLVEKIKGAAAFFAKNMQMVTQGISTLLSGISRLVGIQKEISATRAGLTGALKDTEASVRKQSAESLKRAAEENEFKKAALQRQFEQGLITDAQRIEQGNALDLALAETRADEKLRLESRVENDLAKTREVNAAKITELEVQRGQAAKDGAKALVVGATSAVTDIFLPGFGGVAGQIVAILAEGPEKIKELVSQLLDSVADIVVTVVESLPDLIVGLVDSLSAKLPVIAIRLAVAMAKQAPFIMNRITIAFIKNIPFIAKSIGEEIANVFNDLVEGLKDFFKDPIKSVGSLFGFEQGGLVPGVVGAGPIPAFVDPGELIVPPSATFDDIVNAAKATRGGGEVTSGGGTVNINFETREAARVLTAQQVQNNALGFNDSREI